MPYEGHGLHYVDGLEAEDDRRMPPAWQRITHAQHRAEASKALLPSSYCNSSPQEAAAGCICRLRVDAQHMRLAGAGAGVSGGSVQSARRGCAKTTAQPVPFKEQQQ